MKRKPGPKPKPAEKLAVKRTYSYTPEHAAFLDALDAPGAFIRKLINNSEEFNEAMQLKAASVTQNMIAPGYPLKRSENAK